MISQKKSIIITGASSGLGRALAENYAQKGNCKLFLFGRSPERLAETAKNCRINDVTVECFSLKVEDKDSLHKEIGAIAEKHGVDIVTACAGVSAGTLDGIESDTQVDKIFSTNINGVINTIMPALKPMIARRKGQVVIISSMAGLLGMSSSPSYSASKGAVKMFGDALAAYLRKYKIYVTVVLPGFVKTPMTDVNQFPMPFMISADKAAKKIIHGVEKRKLLIAFPRSMYFAMKILNILPTFVVSYINSKLPGKPKLFDADDDINNPINASLR